MTRSCRKTFGLRPPISDGATRSLPAGSFSGALPCCVRVASGDSQGTRMHPHVLLVWSLVDDMTPTSALVGFLSFSPELLLVLREREE
jgi:hypothetical protein